MNALLALAPAVAGKLLLASLVGGLLAAAVWTLQRAFPALPGAVRRWLWWGAALVMLLALLPLPRVPLAVLPARVAEPSAALATPAMAPHTAVAEAAGDHELAAQAGRGGGSPAAAEGSVPASWWPWHPARPVSWRAWAVAALVAAWALGAALRLARAAADLLRIRRLVAGARPTADPHLAAGFARLSRALGTPRAQLRLSAAVDTPQVVGALRPVVILPEHPRLGPEELELTLAHELVHVRHRDLLLGLVPALAERLLFFHPLARLAAREHALAFEAHCDAAVLDRLAPSPRAYGRLLLKLSLVPSSPLPAAVAVVTQRTLHRRLEMLLSAPRASRAHWGWLALPAAFALLLPFRLTAAATAPRATEPAEPVAAAPSMAAPAAAAPAVAAAAPMAAIAPQLAQVAEPAVAPAPPSPPRPRRNGYYVSYGDDGDAWALLQGEDDATTSGNWGDLRRARRAAADAGQPVLWVRRDGEEWVVTDPAILARVDAAMEPQRELGHRQAALGARQAELGSEQAALGERQAALGARQAALGERQAALGAKQAELAARMAHLAAQEAELAWRRHGSDDAAARALEREREALAASRRPLEQEMRRLDAAMDELGDQQRELGSLQGELGGQQGALGSRQGELGSQQGELGSQQAEAARRVQRLVDELVDEAVRTGKARRLDR